MSGLGLGESTHRIELPCTPPASPKFETPDTFTLAVRPYKFPWEPIPSTYLEELTLPESPKETGGKGKATKDEPLKLPKRSKRCRDARVHNLTERGRRSVINEKIQKLYSELGPHSTSKATKGFMLDKTITNLRLLICKYQLLQNCNLQGLPLQ